jgi:drug/metabolite transporter (DMT)-like permease
MPPANRPLLAAAWMTGSVVAFTAMAIATRAINQAHDTFEILAYRSLLGLGVVLAVASISGRTGQITAQRLPAHALRNTVHFTGQALWFWAITQVPLAQVFALEFTAPLWIILLSPILLGEVLTRTRALAAILGFGGILCVVRPDFGQPDPGLLAAAACAVFFALSIILTKRLTRSEKLVSILFWMCLFQSGFGLLLSLGDGQITLPNRHTLPWLALIGVAGLTAHLCLTRALQLAPASFVAPIDFVRLPLIAAIGALFYAEPVSLWLGLGAALILAANWLSLRAETSAQKPKLQTNETVTRRH